MSTTVIYSNFGDSDTELLRGIWQGLPDVHLVEIRQDSEDYEYVVDAAIEAEDDTIVFAGHGTSRGLLFPDFNRNEYILHENNVGLIHARRVVCVWCYASDFCRAHNLHNCFCTGMFISNIDEAMNIFTHYDDEILGDISDTEIRFCNSLNYLLSHDTPITQWADEYFKETGYRHSTVEDFNYDGLMSLE